MTRKLTNEQVKAIKKLRITSGKSVIISHSKNHDFFICKMNKKDSLKNYWYISSANLPVETKYIETFDEAIAYAEHLLNQRYCWLPQNNGWIMSGEVYNFVNNGANKVMELLFLSLSTPFDCMDNWYIFEGRSGNTVPNSIHYAKGITIPANSPIWDAVKGVE